MCVKVMRFCGFNGFCFRGGFWPVASFNKFFVWLKLTHIIRLNTKVILLKYILSELLIKYFHFTIFLSYNIIPENFHAHLNSSKISKKNFSVLLSRVTSEKFSKISLRVKYEREFCGIDGVRDKNLWFTLCLFLLWDYDKWTFLYAAAALFCFHQVKTPKT